jgi:hypothetical protein
MSPRKPLRVGFDLDGVLLYNPIRVFRPIITWVKRDLLGRKQTKFFVPHKRWQQVIFIWLHKTSLWVAPGLDEIKAMADAGLIEPYLITARFSFLQDDLDFWLKKIKADSIFKGIQYNQKDEQPFIFKARQIHELKLDVFVEDNWDIVTKLNDMVGKHNPKFVCWWVSNILDWSIGYPKKVDSLRTAVRGIKEKLTAE